jgi:hypothetical protein
MAKNNGNVPQTGRDALRENYSRDTEKRSFQPVVDQGQIPPPPTGGSSAQEPKKN